MCSLWVLLRFIRNSLAWTPGHLWSGLIPPDNGSLSQSLRCMVSNGAITIGVQLVWYLSILELWFQICKMSYDCYLAA